MLLGSLLFLLPLILALAGCAAMFEFNLFSAFDRVELPDAAALNAMSEEEALAYLDEELDSAAFVTALAGDPQALGDVEGYLAAAKGAAGEDNEKWATVLYADLELKVYGGEELVNNAASLLLGTLPSVDFTSAAQAEDFLKEQMPALVPAAALASREAFDAMLDGMRAAWGAYDSLGAAIDGDPLTADVPDSVNLGDVSQKALFAFILDEALTGGKLYDTEADARQSLWDMANGRGPTGAAAASPSFDDPLADPSLSSILDEAEISFS